MSTRAIPAKKPPTAEEIGESAILIDVHLRAREIAGPSGNRSLSAEIWTRELRAIRSRVLHVAIAEYLRRFPMSRDRTLYTQVTNSNAEHVFGCLFCRETTGRLGLLDAADNQRWWALIYDHVELCAYRMLAGQIEPVPPGRNAREPAVANLVGGDLFRSAQEAAEYLGVHLPPVRTLRRMPVRELRDLITSARAEMREIAESIEDERDRRAG